MELLTGTDKEDCKVYGRKHNISAKGIESHKI